MRRAWAFRAGSLLSRLSGAGGGLFYGAVVVGLALSLYQVWSVQQPETSGQRIQIDFLWPTYTPQKVRYGEYLAQEYMRRNPDVYVNLILSGDPYPKLQVMIAGRTAPDVVWMGVGWQQFVDALMPLDALVANDPEVGPANYPPSVWDGVKWEGKVYGLPSGAQTAVVYFNKDLFRDAGVECPTEAWTWDDMVRMAKALTRDFDGDGMIDQYGLQLEQVYRVPFLQYVRPVADPTWSRAQIDHPATVAIMEAYRDLIYKHRVMPTPMAASELGMLPMFEAGRMAMHAASAYAIESFRKTPFDWDIVSFPWFEYEGNRYRSTGLWQEEFCILADTDTPEESWKFAKWCASRELVRWASVEGHIVPARLDVAYSEAFLNPNVRPAHIKVFLDSWEFATPVYPHPWWKRISTDLEPIWQQFMVGTEGVRVPAPDAIRQLDEALQKILDDYHAQQE
jgi:multiple sugar transport system substrate-binding protein